MRIFGLKRRKKGLISKFVKVFNFTEKCCLSENSAVSATKLRKNDRKITVQRQLQEKFFFVKLSSDAKNFRTFAAEKYFFSKRKATQKQHNKMHFITKNKILVGDKKTNHKIFRQRAD